MAEGDAAAAARLVIARAVEEQPLRTASSLPEYRDDEFEFESNGASLAGRIMVPRELYGRIRGADGPVFEHASEWEGGRYVVFDPATGRAIAVLEAWL
jgi:hypothetical protein